MSPAPPLTRTYSVGHNNIIMKGSADSPRVFVTALVNVLSY